MEAVKHVTAEGNLLAYLPITLRHETQVLAVVGLLDTGSTVNVLPYPLGLQLGFVWEQQTGGTCSNVTRLASTQLLRSYF
jgi:hypothetical protein